MTMPNSTTQAIIDDSEKALRKVGNEAKQEALDIIQRCYDGELGGMLAKLTEKQKLFALHLANPDNSAAKAAQLAGYSFKNSHIQAYKTLRGPHAPMILACKKLFSERLLAETGLTQTYYRTKLINIAEANQVDNPQVSISALKLLGESAGFTGSSKSGGTNININISGLPDLGSDCIEVN